MISTEVRWRQYVMAREIIINGELVLSKRFRHMDLERISEALNIPRKSLIKVSYAIGKKGRLETKDVLIFALIQWAKAVIRRDSIYFHCKPIWIE